MPRKLCVAIVSLVVAIFVGSLFIWAAAALLASVAFAIFQQLEFAALFAIASFSWFGCGVFFVRLPHQQIETHRAETAIETAEITPSHRRVAAAFGVVMGSIFGLAVSIVAVLFATSAFLPVAVMVGVIFGCTLLCYALPNVGPEILLQLDFPG